eukprot:CAMPEP_0171183084 /NCGR_PEP_ID=MMETSP0790-20130122/15099_1 /TAXON_ID=2925 /ORGANISM="Alexandrium catenella, Strain OF101" /LENGTH=56 /DNA_ID=CAMNT_0011648055 /DNA_START=72 /DNA_END=239 /DNA_ORIENTATION=+
MAAVRAVALLALVGAAQGLAVMEQRQQGETPPGAPAGAQIAPFGKEDTAKELQSHA